MPWSEKRRWVIERPARADYWVFGYIYTSLTRRFSLRNPYRTLRQQFWQYHRHGRRLHCRRDLEWITEQHREYVWSAVLHPAELAARDGIPVVDLLRNNRHVFGGDFVPDWPRTSPVPLTAKWSTSLTTSTSVKLQSRRVQLRESA